MIDYPYLTEEWQAIMFTEQSLRDHPALVKALPGLEAEEFWPVAEEARAKLADPEPTWSYADRQRMEALWCGAWASGVASACWASGWP